MSEIIKNAFDNIDPKAHERTKFLITMMEYQYAIEVLQKEKDLIDKALKETERWHNHKESWKRQQNKSDQLGRALRDLSD